MFLLFLFPDFVLYNTFTGAKSYPARIRLHIRGKTTHVHINQHAIALVTANRGRNNDQRIFIHEIPYTSLVLDRVARVRLQVELQSQGGLQEEGDHPQQGAEGVFGHRWRLCVCVCAEPRPRGVCGTRRRGGPERVERRGGLVVDGLSGRGQL